MTHKEVSWERWKNPLIKHEDDDENYDQGGNKGNVPILVGPFGVLPIGESNDIGKAFNFWILHTNFNITDSLFGKIKLVEGVESLDPQSRTRYRCRVGIGKVFDEDTVKEEIEKTLGVFL